MAKTEAERLFIAGGEDKVLRLKYDEIGTKEQFVTSANEDGFAFTLAELDDVLRESGDSFESYGNPRKRGIWWT
jgi:hypothetical protein